MPYDFERDIRKAKSNFHKHKISFERAATIFRDRNIPSILDEEHSDIEERWLTMGLDSGGILLAVSHTFADAIETIYKIRIISALKATKTKISKCQH